MFSKMALPKHSEQQFRQHAKKVVSDSPGLVDFIAIRLVIFVLILPDRQVLFYGETQITEGL